MYTVSSWHASVVAFRHLRRWSSPGQTLLVYAYTAISLHIHASLSSSLCRPTWLAPPSNTKRWSNILLVNTTSLICPDSVISKVWAIKCLAPTSFVLSQWTLWLNLLLNIASQLAAHKKFQQLFAKQNIKATVQVNHKHSYHVITNNLQAKIQDKKKENYNKQYGLWCINIPWNIYETVIFRTEKYRHQTICFSKIMHPPFMHAPLLCMRSEMAWWVHA